MLLDKWLQWTCSMQSCHKPSVCKKCALCEVWWSRTWEKEACPWMHSLFTASLEFHVALCCALHRNVTDFHCKANIGDSLVFNCRAQWRTRPVFLCPLSPQTPSQVWECAAQSQGADWLLFFPVIFEIQRSKPSGVAVLGLGRINKSMFTAEILPYIFSLLLSSSGRNKIITSNAKSCSCYILAIYFLCIHSFFSFWQNYRFAKEGNWIKNIGTGRAGCLFLQLIVLF